MGCSSQAVIVCLLIAGLSTALSQSLTPLTSKSFNGFISVSNGRFVDESCAEYPVIGFNGCALAVLQLAVLQLAESELGT